jgi:hypothetical protein
MGGATLIATCSARSGYEATSHGFIPAWCNVHLGLRSYTDERGFTRHYCAQHEDVVRGRWPENEPYVSEIADDPLGQEKAARDISDFKTPDQHGETCWYAGHAPGCPCRAGGDVELRPGWISFEEDGHVIEVEVAP